MALQDYEANTAGETEFSSLVLFLILFFFFFCHNQQNCSPSPCPIGSVSCLSVQ